MLRAFLCGIMLLTSMAGFAAEESWTDKVDLGMDFRYRHEMQDAEESTNQPRHRQRIRARFSLSGEVDENVRLYLRLSTGSKTQSDTIASGNQTLGDGGANKSFWVDKAYMEWKACDSSTIHLGKFGVPFYTPAKSQLIWDGDYTPEGFAYMYKRKTESVSYFFNAGAMWLDENSAANDSADQGIVGAQLGAEISMGEPKLVVAIANHAFPNLKDSVTINGGATGKGNSTYTQGGSEHYLYDYNLLEGSLELKSDIADMPSSLYLNYVQNQDPSKDNQGYLAGFKIGKVKEKTDVAFIYNYRKVEKDAVISALWDSDFADGKTDVEGHTVAVVYGIFKNSDVALAYFTSKRSISTATKTDYSRAHLDFSFKF